MIGSLIVGALCGWIASKIMNTDAQMGALANIIVGLIGGVIGGAVARAIGFSSEGGTIWQIFLGVIGAVILLWIVKKIKK